MVYEVLVFLKERVDSELLIWIAIQLDLYQNHCDPNVVCAEHRKLEPPSFKHWSRLQGMGLHYDLDYDTKMHWGKKMDCLKLRLWELNFFKVSFPTIPQYSSNLVRFLSLYWWLLQQPRIRHLSAVCGKRENQHQRLGVQGAMFIWSSIFFLRIATCKFDSNPCLLISSVACNKYVFSCVCLLREACRSLVKRLQQLSHRTAKFTHF